MERRKVHIAKSSGPFGCRGLEWAPFQQGTHGTKIVYHFALPLQISVIKRQIIVQIIIFEVSKTENSLPFHLSSVEPVPGGRCPHARVGKSSRRPKIGSSRVNIRLPKFKTLFCEDYTISVKSVDNLRIVQFE